MIQLTIEVKIYESGYSIKKNVNLEENSFVISNQFFTNHFPDEKWLKNTNYYIQIYIMCNLATVIIENFTLSESLSIHSYRDAESKISILKCFNTNLHIVGVDVKHLELEKGNILIADLDVDELYLDSRTFFTKEKDTILDDYSNIIDVRRSNVEKLIFHQSPMSIVFTESSVKEIVSYKQGEKNFEIGLFSFYKCNVEYLYIGDIIKKMQIEDSLINRMFFASNTNIEIFENTNSDINFINECKKEMFKEKNNAVWKLIKQGNYKKNLSRYSEAGFWNERLKNDNIICKENNKVKKTIMYFSDWFLRTSNGYGYKPINAIIFSVICILGFGISYSVIDFIIRLPVENLHISVIVKNTIESILQNIYLSGISFTTIGFGELGNPSWISRFLMVVEGCLGVATLSLFVAALLKKYTD